MKLLVFVVLFAVFCGGIQANMEDNLDKLLNETWETLPAKDRREGFRSVFREWIKLQTVFEANGYESKPAIDVILRVLDAVADKSDPPKDEEAFFKAQERALASVNDVLLFNAKYQKQLVDALVTAAAATNNTTVKSN